MGHVNAPAGAETNNGRRVPFGRGTARLCAFTALGMAAGALIGAGAMVQMDDRRAIEAHAPTAAVVTAAQTDAATATREPQGPAGEAVRAEAAKPAAPDDEKATAPAMAASAQAEAAVIDTPVLPPPVAARFGDIAAPTSPLVARTGVSALEATVEIAETEAEAVRIEERLSAAGAAYFELPPKTDDPFEAALWDDVPLAPARTNAWVNMRAGPDNDAEVLTVVPGGAELRARTGCAHWCEVVYEGRRGYIYKSFIRR